jgi:hypothetical protein
LRNPVRASRKTELGLERYIAGVFENTVLDETTERLANGISVAVKAYTEAVSLVEEALTETPHGEDDGA